MRYFVAIALLMLSAQAVAVEHSILINGKTWHIGSDRTLNEINSGIGYQVDFSGGHLIAVNAMRDSHSETSWNVGAGWQGGFRYAKIGAVAFAMHRRDAGMVYGALPFLYLGTGKIGVNIFPIPAFGQNTTKGIFAQIKWRH